MEGELVYVIVQHLMREGDKMIMSIHATWEGAYQSLLKLAEIESDYGYEVTLKEQGIMEERIGGKMVYEFRILTRQIEK